MKQVEINGLLWDTENLEVNGVKYFTWEEANNIAKSLGKRVPTRDELKQLIKTGIEWDHDIDVLWFSDKKLSLPADGIIPQHGDEICAKGRFVHIWSSTINTDIGNAAYFLNANCADINVINTSLCNKVPVRLVQDKSKQIEINGLLWDTENLEIDGKKFFTWQEAMDAAKIVGKRLPTKEEFEALIYTDWEYSEANKGIWFADNKLFFPMSGCLAYSSGNIQSTIYGCYWSSSPRGMSYSWGLNFDSSSANVLNSNVQNGFPIRCVQDISSNSVIKEEVISTPTVSCNISVKSIAKMQKTIDVQKNYLDYVLLKLLYPHKINHIFLDPEVDSTTFKIICEKLEKLYKDNPRKYLYVRGSILCPEISCPNYEYFAECEDEIENDEAIAYFPEDKVPDGAIIIDGDLILSKELVIDGYTLLCAKEITGLD